MPSDLHPMSCSCAECCVANNLPRQISSRGLAWFGASAAMIAFWGWIIATLATANIPALAF